MSLVAFRSIPISDEYEYQVNGTPVDAREFQHATADLDRITVTSDQMYETLTDHDRGFHTSVYLPGTAAPETHKFLVAIQLGSSSQLYGYLGPRTVEAVQVAHHWWTGRYVDFLRSPTAGKQTFLMAAVDPVVRQALRRFARAVLKDPRRLLEDVYVQSISLQQPNEMLDGKANLCGGCPNMMVWNGELIHSCRLDEYRMFGGLMTPVRRVAASARIELG